jgi:hypothetical protein
VQRQYAFAGVDLQPCAAEAALGAIELTSFSFI